MPSLNIQPIVTRYISAYNMINEIVSFGAKRCRATKCTETQIQELAQKCCESRISGIGLQNSELKQMGFAFVMPRFNWRYDIV